MTPSLRPVTPDDAAAIAAIYRPFVTDSVISFELDPPDAGVMAERIAAITARFPYLVAELSGEVIGYAYATRYRERAAYAWVCETAIYVDRNRARRGIGRALYEALLDALSDRGFVTAIASITVPNRQSTAFHEALGFEHRGTQTGIGHKHGRWHDVAFYQADLAPRPSNPQQPRQAMP